MSLYVEHMACCLLLVPCYPIIVSVAPPVSPCVLGIMCNKPIRVSSPIPFKSQLRLQHGGFAIYTVEFARATASVSREEMANSDTCNDYPLVHVDIFIFM